ncbi:YceI family protein [Roseibacterium beibuensis]|uniref:YceI family protein n=1 Tax=[Roseibacterium] beibuensis TaxID=1193142 RepID=UPI00217EAE82|nr:YceI family protein [Roseibacterium beibuensis]MCS6624926.1 YceI family protein [Roseibacterium beibuensis]
MKRRAVLLRALAVLGLGGWTDAPPAWEVLRDASTIEMSVRALGGSHRGRFDDWRGDIAFDPEAPSRTRATVVVQTGSLTMRPAAVARRAVGPSFLDAARYPEIRFDLRSMEPLGGDRYTARAEVTMKGRTRPVAFPVDLRVTGDRAHLTGAFTLDRTEFGIGTRGAWNRMVGREVTVRVALQARRR